MNVSVVGVGTAGEVTARLLGTLPEIDRFRIADVREERLEEVSGKIPREVDTERVDLRRAADVRRACREADILVNATLPPYNLALMREALRLRAHYVDLASEGSPDPKDRSKVHEELALDDAFRRIDRVAILGMGVAPGMTNLLSRHAADAWDRIDAIRIRVYGSGYSQAKDFLFSPLFSPETFLEEVLWPAPVWKGHRIEKLPPFSGEEEFRFPDPLGIGVCYNVNNEECETMPRFLGKGPGFIDFKYAIAPRRKDLLESLYRLGLTRPDPVRVDGFEVAPLHVLLALLPDPSSVAGRVRGATCIVVEIEGRRGRSRIRRRLWTAMDHGTAYRKMGVHATAFLTGAPPAAAVQALLDGEVERRGVTTGGGIDSDPILRRAKAFGVPMFEGRPGARKGAPLALA